MKRPWNLVDSAVYSLSTSLEGNHNMNICTYVTPINMNPKIYAIAVYHNTQTLQNIQSSEYCVLQILSDQQYKLVNVLGKRSGFKYNKINYLVQRNMVHDWQHFTVLNQAVASILLHKINCIPSIDHDLYLFEVMKYKVNNQDLPLTLNTLRLHKIISI